MKSDPHKDLRISPPEKEENSVVDPLRDQKYFQRKFEILTFAAALGYRANRRRTEFKRGEGIKMDYFRRQRHDLVVDLLGVDHGRDLTAISTEQDAERIALFESYAAAGLDMLGEECFHSEGTVLDGLLRLIEKYGFDADDLDAVIPNGVF